MRTIMIRYGIGYGEHETAIDVPDDATVEEIERDVQDSIMERVWWAIDQDGEGA